MPTLISAFGECKSVLEWTRDPRCVVSLMTLLNRSRTGWEGDASITTPSNAPADRFRRLIEAFGETKSIADWQQDPRAKVDAGVILSRLKEDWKPEAAIATESLEKANLKPRMPSRLYHGRTITEWLNDPRCRVSRFTLERNLRGLMPIEEALVYRKRGSSTARPTPKVEEVGEALRLLGGEGELWHYSGYGEDRTSILHESYRYELENSVFDELKVKGYLKSIYKSASVEQFGLSPDGRRAAKTQFGAGRLK